MTEVVAIDGGVTAQVVEGVKETLNREEGEEPQDRYPYR